MPCHAMPHAKQKKKNKDMDKVLKIFSLQFTVVFSCLRFTDITVVYGCVDSLRFAVVHSLHLFNNFPRWPLACGLAWHVSVDGCVVVVVVVVALLLLLSLLLEGKLRNRMQKRENQKTLSPPCISFPSV